MLIYNLWIEVHRYKICYDSYTLSTGGSIALCTLRAYLAAASPADREGGTTAKGKRGQRDGSALRALDDLPEDTSSAPSSHIK